jgi:hypothetical protein
MKMKLFLSTMIFLIACQIINAQDTSYTNLIDTTIAGRKLYQLQVVQVGSNGFQKVETTPRIDSATLVGQLYGGAKDAKTTLRNPMRVIASQNTQNRVFNNNNALLLKITGKNYFEVAGDIYGKNLVNDPQVDTVTTKVINGATFTSYVVYVNGIRTFCRVNDTGIFQEIPSQTTFAATSSGKRGRLLLYDSDFGRFAGIGDIKIIEEPVDVVLVGKLVDENNRPIRELWSSIDGNVKLLKNLPK